MKKTIFLLVAVVMVVTTGMTAGCGGEKPAEPLEKVTIGISVTSLLPALVHIAEERGYFLEEAIALTKQETYDIIFIDMKLPTINGLKTYLALKEIQPEAVVIIMTGYHEEMGEMVRQALNNSAYTCLYKPLDMAEVLRLVDEILTEKQKSA